MDMQPHSTLLCALLLGACFHDSGGSFVDGNSTESDDTSTLSDQDSSDVESDDDETNTDQTWSETDDTSGSVSDSEAATGTSTDTTSYTSTGSGTSDDCVPVDVEIDGAFEGGESRTIYLDFDDFPGMVGETAELCITFTTTNYASMRTITVGGADGEPVGFGPCGPWQPDPGPFTFCKPYVKPEGLVEVIIDNLTTTPGCQDGPMDDLVLQFMCP